MARKRKSTGPSYKAEGGVDYGPSLRLAKDGRLKPFGGAADIEVGNRDDPSVTERRVIVRGARRRDVLTDLQARKIITKRMRDAAEEFLDDCSIATGSVGGELGELSSLSGIRTGWPERQVSAITRVNNVRHLLGFNSGTVFWWVVFDNGSLNAYEKRHKLRNGTATGMLRDALNALDEYYHAATYGKIS